MLFNKDGHSVTDVNILEIKIGFTELKIFGDEFKVLSIVINFCIGKAASSLLDVPRTANNKSKQWMGITPIIWDVTIGFSIFANIGTDIVFTNDEDESFIVSNKPSKKPKRVDGDNFVNTSWGGLSDIYVKIDINVGSGRQLNNDLDIETTVIKWITVEWGKSSNMSLEVIIPITNIRTDFGMVLRMPGESENNPFKYDILICTDKLCKWYWFDVIIINTDSSSEWERLENNWFVFDNIVTRLIITVGGNELVNKS